MERKTKIHAEEGRQEIFITREFDLPLELLFKAYEEAEFVEQWMGTRVLKLENKKHGSWQFETKNASGEAVFKANGVIHDFIPNKKIIRTFEMEDTDFPVQLEFFEFEAINEHTSRLQMHLLFKTVDDRDRMLRLPFAQGINWAHNRLQEIVEKLK